jgi:hypothetical protein
LIETVVLKTILGLEMAVGLSDIVCSSEKDANLPGTCPLPKRMSSYCVSFMRQALQEHLRSCGDIQQMKW